MQIGLELLPTTPVQELTIDEVARRAGISRSLLFHYFATKRELLHRRHPRRRRPADGSTSSPARARRPRSRSPACSTATSGWVETYRETHLAFVRGAAGGDPWVAEVYEETRARLVDVALEALDLPDDARRRQLVLAWFAFTEDLVGLVGAGADDDAAPELLALLRDVLDRVAAR